MIFFFSFSWPKKTHLSDTHARAHINFSDVVAAASLLWSAAPCNISAIFKISHNFKRNELKRCCCFWFLFFLFWCFVGAYGTIFCAHALTETIACKYDVVFRFSRASVCFNYFEQSASPLLLCCCYYYFAVFPLTHLNITYSTDNQKNSAAHLVSLAFFFGGNSKRKKTQRANNKRTKSSVTEKKNTINCNLGISMRYRVKKTDKKNSEMKSIYRVVRRLLLLLF